MPDSRSRAPVPEVDAGSEEDDSGSSADSSGPRRAAGGPRLSHSPRKAIQPPPTPATVATANRAIATTADRFRRRWRRIWDATLERAGEGKSIVALAARAEDDVDAERLEAGRVGGDVDARIGESTGCAGDGTPDDGSSGSPSISRNNVCSAWSTADVRKARTSCSSAGIASSLRRARSAAARTNWGLDSSSGSWSNSRGVGLAASTPSHFR